MEYLGLDFELTEIEDWERDLFIQELAEIGFDAFEETDKGFCAFIIKSQFSLPSLETLLQRFPSTGSVNYQIKSIPNENWNSVWESNFEPILISDRCYVRAAFHKPDPRYPIDIVIDPKMAFGTGHHQTTELMMEYLLEEEVSGKTVLDMGCGTGILGILSSKLGAEKIFAVDYDPVCCESAIENSKLNSVSSLSVRQGDAVIVKDRNYDIVLANINRNILLDQIRDYSKVIRIGGKLFLSGFYDGGDLDILKTKATGCGFEYIGHKMRDQWVAAKFNYI